MTAHPYHPAIRFHVALVCMGIAGCGTTAAFRLPDPNVAYIAFGDSATSGAEEPAYPAALDRLIDDPQARVVNEGNGGERVGEGLTRLRALLEADLYPNAVAMLYWEGGNDVKTFIVKNDPFLLFSPEDADYPFAVELDAALDAIEHDVGAAIELAQRHGLDVYVATYFPLSSQTGFCKPMPGDVLLPVQAQRGNAYVDQLNTRIRRAARERGAVVVDVAVELGDTLVADPTHYADCNHLSGAGNAHVANLFLQSLPR